MLRGLIGIWLYVLSAGPAISGAWLREPGMGFSSATVALRHANGEWARELGYYADYGVAPWLTLGIDLNDNDNLSGHAVVFARLPLGQKARDYKLAAELAVGGAHDRNAWQSMYKLTLSYGRAFESIWGPGWIAIDGAFERRGTTSEPIVKLDATLGLSDPNHLRPILQIETARISGFPLFYTITPGVMIPLAQNTQLLIGAEHRVTTHRSLGLKVGVWHRF